MAGFLSLFSKDRAIREMVDSRNAMARNVIDDPSHGIYDVMIRPQSTLIAGGDSRCRMAVAMVLLKAYADALPVIYIHSGGELADRLNQSAFAVRKGGLVTLPPDPIGCYPNKREAVFAIEQFAVHYGAPLSGKALDCLAFMVDALTKFGEPLTVANLDELFSQPPAKVLFALFGQGLLSQDEFDAETERFQLFIDEYAGAKRVVSLMASLFPRDAAGGSGVFVNDLIEGCRILSIDGSLPTRSAALTAEALLENYAEALRRGNRRAVLLVEDFSTGQSAFLDRLLTSESPRLTKIILCDSFSRMGRRGDDRNAVWNSAPNRIIFRHSDADELSALLGSYTKQTVSAHFGESVSAFGLFPTKDTRVGVAPQPGVRRVLPEEIRALGDGECFIQVRSLPEIIKTCVYF